MAKIILPVFVFFLLLSTVSAQERSIISPAKHPCAAGIDFVRALSAEYPPAWSIVVLCNRTEYEKYEKTWRAAKNRGAFTVLAAQRTFILFDLQKGGVERNDSAVALLAHELKHIRCMCTLGEK